MSEGIKIFTTLTLLLGFLSICVYVFFLWFGMELYPKYFPFIPLFFLFSGISLISLVAEFSSKKEMPPLKRMVIIRSIKIVGSIILLIAGILLDKEHIVTYIIVFVLFYITYLLFETKVMIKLNQKKIKQ